MEEALSEQPGAELFRRELPEHITVSVDGVFHDLVPEESVKDARAVGRVVIAMPDFYAEHLAYFLAAASRFVQRFGGEAVGHVEMRLSAALTEAARFMGAPCVHPDHNLPPSPDSADDR